MNYRAIYRDAFNLHAERSAHLNEPDFWDRTCEQLTTLALKYDNAPFCIDLLVCIHAELERQASNVR